MFHFSVALGVVFCCSYSLDTTQFGYFLERIIFEFSTLLWSSEILSGKPNLSMKSLYNLSAAVLAFLLAVGYTWLCKP